MESQTSERSPLALNKASKGARRQWSEPSAGLISARAISVTKSSQVSAWELIRNQQSGPVQIRRKSCRSSLLFLLILSLANVHLCYNNIAPQYPGRGRHPQVRKEIIRSEENYVKGLRTLVGVFLRPMEKWAAQGVDEADITSGGER